MRGLARPNPKAQLFELAHRNAAKPPVRLTLLPVDAETAERELIRIVGDRYRDGIRSAIDQALQLPEGAAVRVKGSIRVVSCGTCMALHIEKDK